MIFRPPPQRCAGSLGLGKPSRAPRSAASLLLCSLLAAPAFAAVTDFNYGMLASGSAPFSGAAFVPGEDPSEGDQYVRTFDTVDYRVAYSLAPAAANRVLTVAMGATTVPGSYVGPALTPGQIAFFRVADLPVGANGCQNISAAPVLLPTPGTTPANSGITADGQTIVCVQSAAGSASTLSFRATVGGAAPGGTTIAAPTITLWSDGNAPNSAPDVLDTPGAQPPLYGNPTLTVSAAPRWQVDKRPSPGGNARFIPTSGPGGENGYVVGFNIGVKAVGSRKGLEALQPDWSFDDDFSSSNAYPGSRLVTWDIVNDYANIPMGPGTEPTNQNACGDYRQQLVHNNVFDNTFYLANDYGNTASTASTRVARGGVCGSASVDNTAKTASFNVTNTDFSLAHFPTQGGTGGATLVNPSDPDASSNEWWVANKTVLLWVPANDLTPGQAYQWTNRATLRGKTLAGADYTSPQAQAVAGFEHNVSGGFSKIYSVMTNRWRASDLAGAGIDSPPADPNQAGDAHVNQAAPGQYLSARLNMVATAQSFGAGYVCEKIDNARLNFVDLRALPPASASIRKDPDTGIVTNINVGDPSFDLDWQLGVGGTGTSGNGWTSHSSVMGEYPIVGVGQPLTTGANAGTQATAGCDDGDATWFPSIAALQTAGYTLADVTRVRGRYDQFPAATSIFAFIPLQIKSTYGHAVADLVRQNSDPNSPVNTETHGVGEPTLESISPNQAIWQREIGAGGPFRYSEAMRITRTEYVGITKTALAPYNLPGGLTNRASAITYRLVVNATSTTDTHANDITVWDVLPQHVAYRSGSSTFGGTPIADPTCAAPGVTPAIGPFAANSVVEGFQACSWTLSNLSFVKAPIGDASGNQLPLDFTVVVSPTAPANTNLLNTAFADSPLNRRFDAIYNGPTQGFQCTTGASCSVGNFSLRVSSDSGLVIDKAVSAGAVPANTGFEYVLSYTAVGNPLNDVRLLDVLPYASGDARGSSYAGTLRLAGPIAAPVAESGAVADNDIVVLYTSNAPGNINRDPYHASHNLAGNGTNSAAATNWCTVAQFGAPSCPVGAGATTAILAQPLGGAQMPAGGSYRLHVPVLAAGNAQGNVYQNDFIADSSSLQARRPSSNVVETRVRVADLVLQKSAAPGAVSHGATVVFTIRVSNNTGADVGAILASPAPAIVMTDPMPAGLLAQLPVTGGTGWNCSASTATLVSCQYTGALPILSGAQVGGDIAITALVTPATATSGVVNNCAGVALSGQTETNTGNNGDCAPITVSAVDGLAVSGRVYEEKSDNTTDDGDAIDSGIAGTSVRLVCTNPAYNQTTTTGADGSYRFTGLQSGAQCTLTETQPSGYTNAYNTLGIGATGQTGGSGTGDSTITLTVGTADSTGNGFAERRTATPGAPTPVPVMAWPGLVLLSLLLGGLGLRRRVG